MVAKWIPREHKQFDWLHNRCVINWAKKKFSHILNSAMTDESYGKALHKCNRYYRKTFATLNKALDTPQIKQCSQNIDKIIPKMISPVTEMKQRRFLIREPNIPIENIIEWTRDVLPLSYFIKEAYDIIDQEIQEIDKINKLNKDWFEYSSKISNDGFHNMLPVIDVGWSMYEYNAISYYSVIGLAILISERSSIEDRIMAYGTDPEWIILEKGVTFYQKVENIRRSIQSIQFGKSYLNKALELVHKSVTDSRKENISLFNSTLRINKVKYPILVVISDSFYNTEREYIERKGGGYIQPLGSPTHYELPKQQRIIYWNVSTHMNTQLPCLYNQRNCIIMSGLNGGLLSNFKTLKTYSKNRAFTPYSFIVQKIGL